MVSVFTVEGEEVDCVEVGVEVDVEMGVVLEGVSEETTVVVAVEFGVLVFVASGSGCVFPGPLLLDPSQF